MEKLNNETNSKADFFNKNKEVPFLNKNKKQIPYKPALSKYNNKKQAAVSHLLDICREYCQTNPTMIMRYVSPRLCDCCNTSVYEYGTVKFIEYHRDGEIKRQVKINVVCPSCLDVHGIVSVTATKLGRILVMKKGLVEEKFDEVMKVDTCVFCKQTKECGMVRMRFQGLPVDIRLCEHHMNMCRYDPKYSEEIKEEELLQKDMDDLAKQLGIATFNMEDAVAAFNAGRKGGYY